MKISNILFLLALSITLYYNMQAQESRPIQIPDKFPEYPGGKEELLKFFIDNLVYPKEAKEKGVEEIVIFQLIIEEDGTFSNIKSYVDKKYDFGFFDEAIRVINLMPKWIPGQINGKNVRTQWVIPVQFLLNSSPYIHSEPLKQIEDHRYFSTDITDDSTDGIYKNYNLKLYQDGRYEMYLSETRSHKMFYDYEVKEWIYSDMILPTTMISEGNYVENDKIFTLMDKNKSLHLEYQHATDTIIRLPIYPNEIKKCLTPIQTLPLLENMPFRGE